MPKKSPLLVFPRDVFTKPRSNSTLSASADADTSHQRGSVVEGVISNITTTSVSVALVNQPDQHSKILASIFLTDLIDLDEENSQKNAAS